jgi:predicted ABC-type ATPase
MKPVVVIGGPNGAGKTTAAAELLRSFTIREFVNADDIARGLSPFNPEGAAVPAGRLMLDRIHMLRVAAKALHLRRHAPCADMLDC